MLWANLIRLFLSIAYKTETGTIKTTNNAAINAEKITKMRIQLKIRKKNKTEQKIYF